MRRKAAENQRQRDHVVSIW